MKQRILLVDDEPNVLTALRRQLRGLFDVEIESDPSVAITEINRKNPFAAIVSDYRMPRINGIEFLAQVKKQSPDTTRLMLTGYADLSNAIHAVNEGNVFRFLTKPCEKDVLRKNVSDAVELFELVTAKKILMEKTLKGSIELLGEITSLVNPLAGEQVNRVRRYVRYFAQKKGLKDLWRYDIAVMLSQFGTLILPPGTLDEIFKGKEIPPEQQQMYEMHPVIAQSMIQKLPRLESIAEMIAYQLKGFDGSGTPRDNVKEDKIPLGGRILKIALDYDVALQREATPQKAFLSIEKNIEQYDPELMYHLEGMLGLEARYEITKVHLDELRPGMILHQDIVSEQGALLLRKSVELNKDNIDRIHLFAKQVGVDDELTVLVPG